MFYRTKSKEINKDNLQSSLSEFMSTPNWQDAILTTMYHYQTEEYLSRFGKEKILFICLSDYENQTEDTLNRIGEFLSISPSKFNRSALRKNPSDSNEEIRSLVSNLILDESPKNADLDALRKDITKFKDIHQIGDQWAEI